ncbi:MAG: MFS transporter [Acidimicrobiales bacterium]
MTFTERAPTRPAAPPAPSAPTVPSAPRGRREGIALAVIVTCQLMVVLDATVVNIALTRIQSSLHFTQAGLSWVIDAYTLTFGGLMLLGGRAGDIFGRRRMLVLGLAVFTASSLAGGLATSSGMLIAARAVQGVGAAMAAPSTLALIAATFEEGRARNKALGVFSGVAAGGGSLGLIRGGALTSWASWRWVLFINVPIGLAIIVLAPRFVAEPPRRAGRLDLPGALLSTAGLAALIYGFIRVAGHAAGTTVTAGLFAAAVVALGAFVAVEARSPSPLVPLHLVVNRTRGLAYLVMMLLPAAMFGMFFFISQYAERGLGYSPLRTGLAFLPLTGAIFVLSRIMPRVLARVGPRPLLVSGLILITVGLAWLSQTSVSQGYLGGIFGPLMLFGLGAGTCFLPLSATILTGVARDDSGSASGMLQAMQQIGGSVGLAVLVGVAAGRGQGAALATAATFTAVALVLAVVATTTRRAPVAVAAGVAID